MPPNATSAVECTGVLNECDAETADGALDKNIVELKHANKRELKLVWRNIILFAIVHLSAVYGLWLLLTSAKIYTVLFGKKTFRSIFIYVFVFFFCLNFQHKNSLCLPFILQLSFYI